MWENMEAVALPNRVILGKCTLFLLDMCDERSGVLGGQCIYLAFPMDARNAFWLRLQSLMGQRAIAAPPNFTLTTAV